MNVEFVINTRVARRYHNRMRINYKTDMTNETFVQNSVDSFAIEMTALG